MPGERVTGIGVDIVDIPRMDRALKRWGDRFIARVFTAAEVDVAGKMGRPLVRLHGETRRLAVSRGVEDIFLSLSHSEKAAVAQAVAVGGAGEVEEEHAI